MDDSVQPELETLKRKRGHRRGQITRIQRRLSALLSKDLREIAMTEIDSLKADFDHEVKLHEVIQEQIEDLVSIDESALSAESTEREVRDDTHYSIRQELNKLRCELEIWQAGTDLSAELDSLLTIREPSRTHDQESFKDFKKEVSALARKASSYFTNEHIHTIISQLREGVTALHNNIRAAEGRSTLPAATTTERPTMYRGTKLKLDLPTFSGQPPDWLHFYDMFSSALDRAGDEYSEREKSCFLLKAMEETEAKEIVKSYANSENGYTEALEALKDRYGSPKRVFPHLVRKMMSRERIHLDQASFAKLRQNYSRPLRAMEQLGCAEATQIAAALVIDQLDDNLMDQWTKFYTTSDSVPTMANIEAFIKPLESNIHDRPKETRSTATSFQPKKGTFRQAKTNSMECVLCKEQHKLFKCPIFLGYDVDKRFKFIKDKRSCTNCLSTSHSTQDCSSSYTCRECDSKHHTLLHRPSKQSSSKTSSASSSASSANDFMAIGEADSDSADSSEEPPEISFLHTAVAKAVQGDRETDVRLVLDTGASTSLITETVATQLRLKRHPRRLNINMSCGGRVSRYFVKVTIQSLLHPDKFITTKLQVVKSLPEVPSPRNIDDIKAMPHLKGLPLADPHFGGKIDILLGGKNYSKCLLGSLVRGLESGVDIQPTIFGWTVLGPLEGQLENPAVLQIQASEDTLKDDLSRLWELDRTPESAHLSIEDEEVTQHFLDMHQRDQDGRYVVCLPRITPTPSLGASRTLAVRRSTQNEKTLTRKGRLSEFNTALEEYHHLDHAEEVPASEKDIAHYYMPVHGVFKASSTTTKVRPVFDASAPTTNGISLNDTLKPGPNLYPQLTDILLKFRTHVIGISADISKMFREVKLHPSERDAHRFLLRDESGQLKDMRMKRLTFGVRSSPYLATQVIRHLAEQHHSSHPQASKAILQNFYVDDYLAGAETVEEATHLREQLCSLLELAGMTLRKWRSSSDSFRLTIPPEIVETADLLISSTEKPIKALGLHWNVSQDSLSVSTPEVPPDVFPSKRSIASNLGKVYDILGLYSPYTITGKILLRKLWELKVGWDEEIPTPIQDSWRAWTSQLEIISNHSVPRRYSTTSAAAIAHHLHGFSDASQEAYGAVVYLQKIFSDSTSTTSIIISKARVMPLKGLTIPRAELTAAYTLAKLLHYCSELLDINSMTAWTDSSIVLCWLRKSPASLNTFVGNRVKRIQELIPNAKWSHVPSASNPADMLSRGVSAKSLLDSELWWKGPPWLKLPQSEWPPPQFSLPDVIPEVKTVTLSAIPEPQEKPWDKFSKFDHMIRILSWCRRFLHNTRLAPSERSRSSTIKAPEYKETFERLISMEQRESYPQAFQALKKNKSLPKGHVLGKYKISLGDRGILLVSTRIRDPVSPSHGTSIIPLPIQSGLTRLLLSSLHERHLHPGTNTLLAIVKDKYHIPGLRNYLKGLSRRCIKCQRAYQQGTTQPMGLLPQVRTMPSAPFLHTGVDFAGPFITKQGYTRKPVHIKSYACLFICMATKAVHLELCLNLSTDEFLSALRRFCARRGCPVAMYSDNGSNFIGAQAELKQIQELLRRSKNALSHFTARNGVEWHFSPPRTPHAGGLWEAAVKQMKLLLRKLVQPHHLRTEELSSILVEVEGTLNSRPLVPLDSTDPDNLALTPGHFLVGRPLKALPTDVPSTAKLPALRRWQLTQRLTSELWAAWKNHYLHTLQTRLKWNSPQHTFRKNDVVLLKEDSLGYRHWPMARITDTFPGDDGVVRVVELLCGGRTCKRSTHLIIPLLPEDSVDQDDQPG